MSVAGESQGMAGRVRAQAGVPRLSAFRRLFTTLGGADGTVLGQARIDAVEMTGRGFAALIPAIFGGFAATVTFRYAYSVSPATAAMAGLGWALLLLLFDMSLMTAAPGRGWASRLATYGARALVSVLAALTFAAPLVLFMYARDISVQVAADEQAGLAAYDREHIVPVYAPAISADNSQIATDQRDISTADLAVTALQQATQKAGVQAVCEAGGLSDEFGCQNGTGRVGRGSAYAVRVSELRDDEANLAAARDQTAAVQARLTPQIKALQADVTAATRAQQAAYAKAKARYLSDDGLIARWRALGELERAYPSVDLNVRLLQALIVAVDLSAVLAKISSSTPSYDRMLEAERRRVALAAAITEEAAADEVDSWREERDARAEIRDAELQAWVDVELEEIRADAEVKRHHIHEWGARQTGGDQGGPDDAAWAPSSRDPAGRRGQGRANRDARIQGLSLAQFVRESRPHEQEPVAMAPPLTKLSWTGLAVLAALAGALLLARTAHANVTGGWIAAAVLALSTALGIYSRGFRQGPSWAHRAAFGTALVSFALPVLIFALNA
jgi:Domain of unknown function (DUF4407)